MHWEWTFNVGNLLTAVVLLIGFVTAHIQNIKKLQDIETKVGMMYAWFQRQVINGNRKN